MTTALGATFTAAVRVIDRVHRSAADVRTTSHPSHAPRFTEHDIHVIAIADGADDGAAGRRNAADFAARKIELRPFLFTSDERRFGTGGTAHARAATRSDFDIVDFGAERNLGKREAVANARFRRIAAHDLHTDEETFRSDDIALDAVLVNEERNTRRPVRIVLDGIYCRDHSVLIASIIDETNVSLVPAAAMTYGNYTLIIATATSFLGS